MKPIALTEEEKNKIYNSLIQRIARAHQVFRAKHFHKRLPEVKFLRKYINPDETIIDAGAHHGSFSKEFASLFNCVVYCFEPFKYNYDILQEVMERYPRARLENVALSDKEGKETLYIPIKRSGKIGTGLVHFEKEKDKGYITENVRTTTLDNYVKLNKIVNITFIKCDIEGAELAFLKGAVNTIAKSKPRVMCEIEKNHTKRMGYDPDGIFQFFQEMGYKSHFINWNKKSLKNASLEDTDSYLTKGDYLFVRKNG